jgi:hypothetical protein
MEHPIPEPEETHEISLRLESYDDIFSDFDIRPYSKRALSVDFLDEIKRASSDKEGEGIELVLFAPEKERSESHEATIRERLSAHFKRHYHLLVAERRRVMKFGFSMVSLGIISMIAASYIHFHSLEASLLTSFLLVFLEPAAWFLLWEGMDQIIFESKSINPDLHFYRKMSSAHGHVHFKSY